MTRRAYRDAIARVFLAVQNGRDKGMKRCELPSPFRFDAVGAGFDAVLRRDNQKVLAAPFTGPLAVCHSPDHVSASQSNRREVRGVSSWIVRPCWVSIRPSTTMTEPPGSVVTR